MDLFCFAPTQCFNAPTQVEVCVKDQTIKNAQGGGVGDAFFDYMDERHNKDCLPNKD